MKRIALAALVGLALVGTSATARASSLVVTYNLSGTVSALGALALGGPGSGQMTISYPASGPGVQIAHGIVHLVSYSFNQPVNLDLNALGLYAAILTGSLNYTAPGSTFGFLNVAQLQVGFGTGTGLGTLFNGGFVHCMGVGTPGVNTGCLGGGATTGGTLMNPNTLPFPNSIPAPVSTLYVDQLKFLDTGAGSGPGSTVNFANVFAGALSFPGIGPVTLSIGNLVGQEVSRTFVAPEPSSFSLLFVGLVAAGALGSRHRARRSRK